jgi:hypothetical protein
VDAEYLPASQFLNASSLVSLSRQLQHFHRICLLCRWRR